MNRVMSFGAALALVFACSAGWFRAAAAPVGRRIAIILATMFVSLHWALPAQAGSIVVPGAYATTEGNATLYRENLAPGRFQQLYEASQFSSLGGPVLITGYMARPHAVQSGPAAVSVADVNYWMSTTSRTVSTLSTTFAVNRGADHTLVASYDTAVVYTTEYLLGPGNTRQFDIVQMFTTPFRYDPAEGNLLLEARHEGTTLVSGSGFLGSACSTGPTCPLRLVISSGSADARSGEFLNLGEIDLFLYEPIAAADFDEDGDVDGYDLALWQGDYGAGASGDADGDGDTDGRDFLTWQRQYFAGVPGLAQELAIPEPASLLLALMALAGSALAARGTF